jgi:hypothetical protein
LPSPRLPGQIGSLIWLDLRQSIPLCLAGLILAVLIAIISIMGNRWGQSLSQMAGELPAATWSVGLLWSAIVSVGIFSAELQPGLQQFWRTRPISPSTWYWCKFFAGLIAVVVFLDFIPAAIGWKSPTSRGAQMTGYSYLACMPLLHAEIYAISVMAICWLRRPVMAATAGVVAPQLLESVITSIPGGGQLGTIDIYNAMETAERLDGKLITGNYLPVYGCILVITIISAVVARQLAIRTSASFNV